MLGAVARAQGDAAGAAALVRQFLPEGASTAPGESGIFLPILALQRLASRVALDTSDLSAARAWLEAHDRWLDWSDAALGRVESGLGWAEYCRAAGDPVRARERADRAFAHASQPRQPLALLAARRLLGELATESGDHASANGHLDAALALADACAAPYERALTLLALAELRAAEGRREAARATLAEARAIFADLQARPLLDRCDAVAARFRDAPAPYPARLTAREVEVLRLIAAGRSNREMAAILCRSERTVERHLENLYRKIDAHSKADATAFAFRHGLA